MNSVHRCAYTVYSTDLLWSTSCRKVYAQMKDLFVQLIYWMSHARFCLGYLYCCYQVSNIPLTYSNVGPKRIYSSQVTAIHPMWMIEMDVWIKNGKNYVMWYLKKSLLQIKNSNVGAFTNIKIFVRNFTNCAKIAVELCWITVWKRIAGVWQARSLLCPRAVRGSNYIHIFPA